MTPNPHHPSVAPEPECIHGLGPTACCVICNGRAEAERKEADEQLREVHHLWSAHFDGQCVVCREQIVVNEAIGRNADGGYVCGDCAVVTQ